MIFNCANCLHGRVGISENGYHTICCLSSKKAMECITGRKSHFKNAMDLFGKGEGDNNGT